jgi:hypothetical protein
MPETRYAILIGNSDYPADPKLGNLRLPAQDVAGLADVLLAPNIGQFPKTNVQILINQPHNEVLDKTYRLLKQAGTNDLVLFYFSGHGKLDPERVEKLYLATVDTQSEWLKTTAVPMDIIKEFIDDSRSTRIVIILDCCFSGAAGRSFAKGNIDDSLVLFSGGRGKYIMTASTALQTAQEKEGDEYSVFTKYLIEGLKTGKADLNQNGQITVDELYQYVYSRVREVNHQEPMRWVTDNKGDLVLALNPQPTPIQRLDKIKMDGVRLGRDLKAGKIIPFLGPGVLFNGSHRPSLGLEALAQQLAQQSNLPNNSLTLVAQSIVMSEGRGVLYRRLKDEVYQSIVPQQPMITHRFLASLPKPLLFFSTAYDNLLEQAFEEAGKPYVVVTHALHTDNSADRGKVMVQYSNNKQEVALLLSEDLVIDLETWSVIYKIHGAFDLDQRIDREMDSLVASEEDYVIFLTLLENAKTTMPNLFVRYFRERPFLFLGYSLVDWNFRAIIDFLSRKANFKRCKPYAISPTLSDFERQYWEYKNVNVIELQVSKLVADMAHSLGITL